MDSVWKMFVLGLSQGAFKTQARKGSSCLSDGYELGQAVLSMGWKSILSQSNDDMDNFNDVFSMFVKKCNLADSIEGTIVNNYIINRIDQYDLKVLNPVRVAIKVTDILTFLSDMAESAMAFTSFTYHQDLFNVGVLLGKLGKILTQAWMAGWLS